MAGFARGVIIAWTLVCLVGALYGCASKIWALSYAPDIDAASVGVGAKIIDGFLAWFMAWLLVTVPALVIYLISPRK